MLGFDRPAPLERKCREWEGPDGAILTEILQITTNLDWMNKQQNEMLQDIERHKVNLSYVSVSGITVFVSVLCLAKITQKTLQTDTANS